MSPTGNRPFENHIGILTFPEPLRAELKPIALVRDGECLGRSLDLARHPLADWLSRQRHSGWLLESMLPEIRTLAMLLAARRPRVKPTPARLSDEADWLAARIYLLRLEKVEMAEAEKDILARANDRLRELCGAGAPAAAACPAPSPQPAWLLAGWAPFQQAVRDIGGAAAMASNSRRLRPQCRQRLDALLPMLRTEAGRSGLQPR
ncbi:hypothetical protein [Chromobacterium vaccinii]|uniref:Uncharacterized protein n=1 Tax=Chromobacterium vaccinii TaxID=1108595 RepID=A0A1D9LFQ1_9NEIS|nr:hypothetical protein [Chromobacterium vaccinii]AOZ50091.1 hypothetical protein BKX93_08870 [Chromobacterium vaccinii]QND83680.1 Uncharacterized protein ChrSW_1453 [Chromobacterium vaccinii]QND88911.1 Uncharacterized protein ChrSV_1453 [Chromobacterium vaccinii]